MDPTVTNQSEEIKPIESKPQESESESDGEIEVKKPEKIKRILTDKQKETLQKGRERRKENMAIKKAEIAKIKEQEKTELDQKIVKKAILIKKRQIKNEKLLQTTPDEDEVEDEPVRAPRKTVNYPLQPQRPQPPKIVFI